MDRFAGLVLKASQTLGAPLYVAAHLGVEPYDIYRWIAGTQLPEPTRRQSLEQRLLSILDGKLERKPQAAQGSTPERRWRDRRVFQPSESIATAIASRNSSVVPLSPSRSAALPASANAR